MDCNHSAFDWDLDKDGWICRGCGERAVSFKNRVTDRQARAFQIALSIANGVFWGWLGGVFGMPPSFNITASVLTGLVCFLLVRVLEEVGE